MNIIEEVKDLVQSGKGRVINFIRVKDNVGEIVLKYEDNSEKTVGLTEEAMNQLKDYLPKH
jgi:predicted transcriptional regulator